MSVDTFRHNFPTEAEFKEKHGVWDPVPKLTLTLCRLQHMHRGQPYARVDFIPQPGT
jgi:hypothetical protein